MDEFEETPRAGEPGGDAPLAALEMGPMETRIDSPTPTRHPSAGRWIAQFGMGALVVGGLVFGIGKRAELASSFTLVRARQDMQSGRSFQAARSLEQAFKEDKNDRAIRVALVEAYYRAGEPDQARPLLNQLVLTSEEEKRIQPLAEKVETTGELLQQGRDLLMEREFSRALPYLQKAGKECPDSPLPQALLARTYGGLFMTSQKSEDLSACLAAEKRLTEIDAKMGAEIKQQLKPVEVLPEVLKHTTAADAALKAGRPDDAAPELDAADKLYPNSAMVHGLRAVMLAQRYAKSGSADEKRQALEEYHTAVQLNPARAALRPRLGKLAQKVTD